MDITKELLFRETLDIIKKVYEFPEVFNVRIKGIDIPFCASEDRIHESINKGYHDICSDVDAKVFVKLDKYELDRIKNPQYFRNKYFDSIVEENRILGSCIQIDSRYDVPNYSIRLVLKNGVKIDVAMFFMDYELFFRENSCSDNVDNHILVEYFSGKLNARHGDDKLVKELKSTVVYEDFDYLNESQVIDAFWITAVFVISKIKRNRLDTAIDFTIKLSEILHESFGKYNTYEIASIEEMDYNYIKESVSIMSEQFDILSKTFNVYDSERICLFNELWRAYGRI